MIVLEVLSAIFFICLGALITACEAVASGVRRLQSPPEQKGNTTPRPDSQASATAAPDPAANNNTTTGGAVSGVQAGTTDSPPQPAADANSAGQQDTNAVPPPADPNDSVSDQEHATMTTSTTTPVSKLVCKIASGTDVGRVRVHNEDNLFVSGDNMVVAVADGMGGHACGEVASALVVDAFKRNLDDASTRGWNDEAEVRSALQAAISLAANDIEAHVAANPGSRGMGTTVVAAAWLKEEVHVAHIGDSRCYRLRSGALTQLTRDHSLLNSYIDLGKLKPEDASTFAFRNVITRALGQEKNKPAEAHKPFRPEKGDVLLLCSDGLNGEVSDDRIAEILRAASEDNLQDICQKLIDEALKNGGGDNITVVLAMFC
jgi:protein phosphatase